MRSTFLVLLFANLILFAVQFGAFRNVMQDSDDAPRPVQLNAERLRLIRDTSAGRPAPAAPVPPAATAAPG